MTFYVTDQNTVVIVLLLFGAFCGVLRDIIIAKRRVFHAGVVIAFFEDLIFCILLTAVYHMIVFVTNYGYVRWYEFVSVFAGFLLYRISFGKIFGELFYRILLLMKRIIMIILKPFAVVIVRVEAFSARLVGFIVSRLYDKRTEIKSAVLMKRQLVLAGKGF